MGLMAVNLHLNCLVYRLYMNCQISVANIRNTIMLQRDAIFCTILNKKETILLLNIFYLNLMNFSTFYYFFK